MGTKFSNAFRCITSTRSVLFAVALLAMGVMAATSSAQNCVQNEYNVFNGASPNSTASSLALNCTANDVSIAKVTNIRDPQTGNTLSTCFQGSTFSFIADFEIKTTSSQSRENIGLYIATNSTTQALTGSCVDNIISPQHQCPNAKAGLLCGSDVYHETDAAPDNCGDTSSNDNGGFGAGTEKVTLQIDNFSCVAPAGSSTLVLPNCTSWQIPGGTNLCVSPAPSYPYEIAAVPGTKSKCNCAIISLPITPVTVAPIVQKACNTAATGATPVFTQNPNTASPTSCDAGAEGSTVTYTVAITNTSNVSGNNVVVDQICDDQYGNVFTANGFAGPACAVGSVGTATNVSCPPAPIAPGATGTCTFTAVQGEIKTVTDIVSASGHSSVNPSSVFTKSQSNSVTVTSTDAPSTATVAKSLVGTEAACATVRYGVAVHNSSGADEALTLSALSDSAYGDLTKLGSGAALTVLGTTCGVANGLGTLSGSAGAGTLPATLTVGGSDYTCQFDAQFCSALDINSCISHSNKVSATLAGDEKEAVTQTGNTLTVKECVSASATSTTP